MEKMSCAVRVRENIFPVALPGLSLLSPPDLTPSLFSHLSFSLTPLLPVLHLFLHSSASDDSKDDTKLYSSFTGNNISSLQKEMQKKGNSAAALSSLLV